ncbi:ligand-binding sensor domain-containing protein [Flavobacterium sp. SM2513]|uniref:ligand-binding sensor domain-containing protein n=1 Tax=Flavobacterium sp. SM2513 TaxID=3424766 RepID=UPI003D7F4535
MKNIQSFFKRRKSIGSAMLFSLLSFSCVGQVDKNTTPLKFKVEQTILPEYLISIRAEIMPEFKLDSHDKKDQGNQISGVVRTVFQDAKGNMWFGTQNGLCRKDQNGLAYFDLKDADGKSVTVHVILEDKKGAIWIGFGGGIAKYDGGSFTVFHEKNVLAPSSLWSMKMDIKGILWIGTTQGIFTFDGDYLTAFEIPEGKIDTSRGVSTTKIVHSIMEDSNGKMWFGTNGGAYVYDGKTLRAISEKDGLQSNFVNSILEDKQGKIWIATTSGLSSFDGEKLTNVTAGILDKGVGTSSLLEDKSGAIWFTTNNGREVYRYEDNQFKKHQIVEGKYGPSTFEIYEDQQYRLWFVGFKGAYRYDTGTFVNITRNGPW